MLGKLISLELRFTWLSKELTLSKSRSRSIQPEATDTPITCPVTLPSLKNALDWLSRDSRKVLSGKPVAVMSAAAGRTGGETAQYVLRNFLAPLRANVVAGPAICVAFAGKEFETGRLENERYLIALEELTTLLKDTVASQNIPA